MVINKRIIIIEDQILIALDLEFLFRNNGYKDVSSFSSGKKAIENIKTKKPDLALLDIRLQDDVSGITVAESLKELDVPFIFVSAFSDHNNYVKAVKLNPAKIFYKPFDPKDLLNAAEEILNV